MKRRMELKIKKERKTREYDIEVARVMAIATSSILNVFIYVLRIASSRSADSHSIQTRFTWTLPTFLSLLFFSILPFRLKFLVLLFLFLLLSCVYEPFGLLARNTVYIHKTNTITESMKPRTFDLYIHQLNAHHYLAAFTKGLNGTNTKNQRKYESHLFWMVFRLIICLFVSWHSCVHLIMISSTKI